MLNLPQEPTPRLVGVLVEDNEGWARIAKTILLSFNSMIFWTQTLGDAKEIIAARGPDFIICDFYLPDGEGLSLARWMRHHSNVRIAATPFILTTADPSERIIRMLGCCGADYLLRKPVKPSALAAALSRLTCEPPTREQLPTCRPQVETACLFRHGKAPPPMSEQRVALP